MNKKVLLFLSFITFSFLLLFVGFNSRQVYADSIIDYTINFYSSENVNFFSVSDIDSYHTIQYNLDYLENNNLTNNISAIQDANLTSTSSYSYVQGYAPSSDKNLILRGVATYTYINDFTFNIKSASGMFFYRLYDKDSNIIDLSNRSVTYSFYVDDYFNSFTINLSSYSTSGNVWTSNIRNSNGVISQSRPRIYYNASTHVWECGLDLWDNVVHKISKIKLEYGSNATSYYSYSGFNNVFSQSEENNEAFNHFLGWSLDGTISKIVNFDEYKLSSDINLYPIFDYNYNFPVTTYTNTTATADTSVFGNYAISSVEALTIESGLVDKYIFELDKSFYLGFNSSQGFLSNYNDFNVVVFNEIPNENSSFGCNFAILSNGNIIDFLTRSSSSDPQVFTPPYPCLYFDTGEYTIYISQLSIVYNTSTQDFEFGTLSQYNSYSNYMYNSLNYDMSYFVDMNSETNFKFDKLPYIDYQDTSLCDFFTRFLKENESFRGGFLCDITNISTTEFKIYRSTSLVLSTTYLTSFYVVSVFPSQSVVRAYISSYSNGYVFKNFYFSIYRPVYRTNNSLVLYNFDYTSFVSSINSVTYRLNKNSTYYDVKYTGTLPNSYFIIVSCEEVQNMIFDEYIYLYLDLGSDIHYLNNNDSTSDILLGFDFNFTYYSNPLVASNGSFNYTFTKPSYVDMPFSLIPFYLPVLEAVENVLIFTMFYCPVTSDILRFIRLDEFFGALFNIFTFENNNILLLGVNMGNFILGCIAFIIFFRLIKKFMPFTWGSIKREFRNSEELYSNAELEEMERQKSRLAHHKEMSKKYQNKKNPKIYKHEHYHYLKGSSSYSSRKYSESELNSLYDDINDIEF